MKTLLKIVGLMLMGVAMVLWKAFVLTKIWIMLILPIWSIPMSYAGAVATIFVSNYILPLGQADIAAKVPYMDTVWYSLVRPALAWGSAWILWWVFYA